MNIFVRQAALASLLCILPIRSMAQQGVLFTQYLFNGLLLNPAYAGYQDHLTLSSIYRSQWSGFPGAPRSFSFSADAPILARKAGLGILLVNDVLGAEHNTTAEVDFSYQLTLTENSQLKFGIGTSINQYAVNPEQLRFLEPEALTSSVMINSRRQNLRTGLFWYNQSNYLGLSVNGLLKNREANDGISIHMLRTYIFTAGTLLPFTPDLSLKPSLLIREDFASPIAVDLNLFVLFRNSFWLGLSYRAGMNTSHSATINYPISRNALSCIAEIYASHHWRIGYAYDYSLNSYSSLIAGSHELSIGYSLDEHSQKSRNNKCYYF